MKARITDKHVLYIEEAWLDIDYSRFPDVRHGDWFYALYEDGNAFDIDHRSIEFGDWKEEHKRTAYDHAADILRNRLRIEPRPFEELHWE